MADVRLQGELNLKAHVLHAANCDRIGLRMSAAKGLPPVAPRQKKVATLTTRITQPTRDALNAESVATGRSLSEVAEKWLEEARTGRASLEALLGGAAVAPAIKQLVAFAKFVSEEVGDPHKDQLASEALIEGWRRLLLSSVPRPSDSLMTDFQEFRAADKLRKMAGEVAETLELLPDAPRHLVERAREAAADEGVNQDTKAIDIAEELKNWPGGLPAALKAVSDDLFDAVAAYSQAALSHTAAINEGRRIGKFLAERWTSSNSGAAD
jgi:hypothetical protein